MIHMYHEIARPSEFLWNLRAALKSDGRVIVVDADRPTDRHGTPQRLLVCEFNALGYGLTRFERLPDSESYFAQFEARAPRPARRTSRPAIRKIPLASLAGTEEGTVRRSRRVERVPTQARPRRRPPSSARRCHLPASGRGISPFWIGNAGPEPA